jgi:hypothetical protein
MVKDRMLSPKLRNNTKMSPLTTSCQHVTGGSSRQLDTRSKKKKKKKKNPYYREEKKTSFQMT